MREAPNPCGFLALPPIRDKAVALGNRLRYFGSVFNGWYWLLVTGRDKGATRISAKGGSQIRLSEAKALLVEVYGSPRLAEGLLLDELAADRMPWGSLLQKGEASDDFWKSGPRVNFEEDSASNTPKYRLFFLGGGIDHDDPPRGSEHFGIWLSRPHVLALLPEPTDAEAPAPLASAQWAIAATRRLRDERKIPDGVTKAELARLLETEADKAVRAGQLGRALKASYLENQLAAWGVWPLSSLK
jgi:hypothetical protein